MNSWFVFGSRYEAFDRFHYSIRPFHIYQIDTMEPEIVEQLFDLDPMPHQQFYKLLLPIEHEVPTEPNHKVPAKLADGARVRPLQYGITIPMVSIFSFWQTELPNQILCTQGE